tara:strand:+ start:771 stop:1436 length:666 start_codon:yes stop_codon:yes gene_type:complete
LNFPHFRICLFIGLFFLSSCGIVRESTTPATSTATAIRAIGSGVASWYGPNFHGKATANGEIFDMNALTAAHRTLPFNTVVLVENRDNGQSVIVRINDRGPYVGNRIIDLSRRAAQEIDMINAGTANVELFLMEEGDRPVTDQNMSNLETFTVQIASFQNEQEANTHSQTVPGSRVERVTVSGNVIFRVYYGTYQTAEEAGRAQRDLADQGIYGFVKQAEN